MFIEETHAPESLEDYVTSVVALASQELGIPTPTVRWFKRWSGLGTSWYWRELSGSESGFARPLEGWIALNRDTDLDRLSHVALHEVKHMAQAATFRGPEAEEDACRFAREFGERRSREIFDLMTVTRVVDCCNTGLASTRCWCEEDGR